jgi:large subunit ribosomal protein L23
MIILIKPVVSEKTMQDVSKDKYTFEVLRDANKHQIAEEIFALYKVKPIKINIIRQKPEEKIVKNKFKAKGKLIKKAIITLKKGQKIQGFEIKE